MCIWMMHAGLRCIREGSAGWPGSQRKGFAPTVQASDAKPKGTCKRLDVRGCWENVGSLCVVLGWERVEEAVCDCIQGWVHLHVLDWWRHKFVIFAAQNNGALINFMDTLFWVSAHSLFRKMFPLSVSVTVSAEASGICDRRRLLVQLLE